ncbi:IclR family transcriptional regulator domain-containing protein [Piscinibacter sakaiensis]|uniref:Transcriptional regulator, IclR family n=1 Tax=Piscinibacter sakaiensis TaxID=1547922 RepID=A0A0K8P1Y6_PISS1|nr:helix-turn-helix domain-containing protein [Piscinibacter sakaiensis]GAP36175.1 transcriptional regulator, IclR family [Piscinibacter sakaiensis]
MGEDTVRSVARALAVMKALQRLGRAGLAELQRETGLPKPTLLRLLQTLEAERVAWRAQGDGLWRPAFELTPSRVLQPAHQRLVAHALPALEALRREVVWPSDLAVPDGSAMRLLETTRRASGLAVQRDQIGHRIDLLRSAVGRAYLSACSEATRAALARRLARPLGRPAAELAADLEASAAETRRRGYAERAPGFGGGDAPIEEHDDLLAAIAVPIVAARGPVLGAVNIVWLKRFDARDAIVRRHLPQLLATAAAIGEAAGRRGPQVPAT